MKGILALLFLLLLLCSSSRSQNLVPNPSFEEFEGNCPDSTGFEELKNWYSASVSPDYYITCNTWPVCHVPSNFSGYQWPYEGSGYIGLSIYNPTFEVKEYAQVRLLEVLEINAWYRLSMYVNLADYSGYAISRIGAWLHSDLITGFSFLFTSTSNPQIVSNVDSILSDTTEWIRIEGCFQAKGDEQYLTLGNFQKNSEAHALKMSDSTQYQSCCAYYYMDKIELYKVNSCTGVNPVIPNVFTPDTDGLNDEIWFVSESTDDGYLLIFNRWGNEVYESKGKNIKWDGSNTQGNPLSAGVYFYILTCGNERKNGTITLFN